MMTTNKIDFFKIYKNYVNDTPRDTERALFETNQKRHKINALEQEGRRSYGKYNGDVKIAGDLSYMLTIRHNTIDFNHSDGYHNNDLI